jgi:hypothetical protein
LDTVLCVLTLNIFYEKLLLFLWFWLFTVALVSSANWLFWIFALCTTSSSREMIVFFLGGDDKLGGVDPERFMQILGPDGLFLLRQVAINLGELPARYGIIYKDIKGVTVEIFAVI